MFFIRYRFNFFCVGGEDGESHPMDYDLSINSVEDLESMIEEARANWEGYKNLVTGADLDNPVVNIYRLWKSKRIAWADRATIALIIANTTDALQHILDLKKADAPNNLFNIGINAVEIDGRVKYGGIELIGDNFLVAGRIHGNTPPEN